MGWVARATQGSATVADSPLGATEGRGVVECVRVRVGLGP